MIITTMATVATMKMLREIVMAIGIIIGTTIARSE